MRKLTLNPVKVAQASFGGTQLTVSQLAAVVAYYAATLTNTLGVSTLSGTAVPGFAEAVKALDARLTALGV